MTAAAAWLSAHVPESPESLQRSMRAALAAAEESAAAEGARDLEGHAAAEAPEAERIAAQLAEAGLAALARVAEMESDRSTASELLAADALLTHACEAAAEAGPDALDRLLALLGPERFSAALPGPA